MWLGDGEKEPGRGAQFCTFGQEWSVITSGGGGGGGGEASWWNQSQTEV